MKKIIFLFGVVFLQAAPSAFEAGNLDSDNPYGLTKDEKYIYKNKLDIKKLQKTILLQQKEIKNLKLQLVNVKMLLDSVTQKVNGMESVFSDIDNLNIEVAKLKTDSNVTKTTLGSLSTNLDILQARFEQINNEIQHNKQLTDKNIKTLADLIQKLANNLDKLQTKKTSFKNQDKQSLMDNAINYFKKSEFQKSEEILLYLQKKSYKLNEVDFYLGEIRYKTGDFKNALVYYKKSIKLLKNKQTYFVDDLLYHTAYSFQKLGNIEAAKKSYLKLIKDFPKSSLVKYAKKRLQDLEKTK